MDADPSDYEESAQQQEAEGRPGETFEWPTWGIAWPRRPSASPSPQGSVGQEADQAPGRPSGKSPAPAGKVKCSFNLLPEDVATLRAMAKQLGTTVTNVLQRAIRDERFVQDQLAGGSRFAIVDQQGNAREIIWR